MGAQYTTAQRAATEKYMEKHTDRMTLRLPKGVKDEWTQAAQAAGESLTHYIIAAVEARLTEDAAMSNNTDRYAIVFSREEVEDTPDNWIVIDTLNSIDSDHFDTLERYVYDAERYLADDKDIGFLRIYDSTADSFVQCDLGDVDIMVVGKEPEND